MSQLPRGERSHSAQEGAKALFLVTTLRSKKESENMMSPCRN